MKKVILMLGILVFGLTSQAQSKLEDLSFVYGEDIPDESGKIVEMIGEANGKIYALNLKGKDEYSLKIFDAVKMKLLSTSPITMPEVDDRELEFERVVMLDGKIYILGSAYYRRAKTFSLVGISINDKGVPAKDLIKLFDTQVENKSNRGDFYFKESPDEKAIGIMQAAMFEKEDMMQYEVKLFDSSLKTIFSTSEKVVVDEDNKKDYEFSISDFDINLSRDVSIVINEGWRDRKKKEKIEKFEVRIFKSANSYKKEVVNIDVTGKEIINCRLFANNHNMLQAVGFYSSVRDNGKANKELKGLYVATIDLKTNSVITTKFNEFDYATKVKLLGERRANKGKDLKPLYTIHSIIERADGGLVVLSEFSTLYIGKKQGIGPLGFQPMTYTRNEIIVNAMKPDGSLEWSGVVPKEQVVTVTGLSLNFGAFAGGGAGGGSFSVGVSTSISLGVLGKGPEFISAIPIFHKEKLYVLFNDHAKNVGITNIEDIRTMSNPNKAVPTLFVFDQKGNMVRKDLEEAAKEELSIRTAVFYRKNSNEFIIYSSRRSVDKIGRMFIND